MRPVRQLALVGCLLAAFLTGCLAAPPDTSKIVKVSSVSSGGYVWDFYRNEAYPCSISGYQTFVIGRRQGSVATNARPLWVKMHGGGTGRFDSTGTPQPTASWMDQEPRSELLSHDDDGLMAEVRASSAAFRILIVSMCSHDAYGGMNTVDPNNPNTTPDGAHRPTTGLISVTSALQFAKDSYTTTDVFLHGTSAGSVGTYNVAWSLELQGLAPDGIVADSGLLNQSFTADDIAQRVCPGTNDQTEANKRAVGARMHPELIKPENQPHLLLSDDRLTVPVAHVWNRADPNSCGQKLMDCTTPTGTLRLEASTCENLPMTRAIDERADGRSINVPVCVDDATLAGPCDLHVVTTRPDRLSTLPGGIADYNAAVMDWVTERLSDD
jgi:hypothetical protein